MNFSSLLCPVGDGHLRVDIVTLLKTEKLQKKNKSILFTYFFSQVKMKENTTNSCRLGRLVYKSGHIELFVCFSNVVCRLVDIVVVQVLSLFHLFDQMLSN